jgi:glycosyltransferase involved in cell wall biosynthesis
MISTNLPFVSVLMTAYNREQYIGEAIESVLASSYVNFELIILDDASIDNTLRKARSYEIKDKRVKVYANEKNLTQWPTRNKAARLAKGKYIKYLDSDDTIYDWGLEYCVEMME